MSGAVSLPIRKSWTLRVSFAFLLLVGGLALATPYLDLADPDAQNLELGPTAPSTEHWFGTDPLGRDLLSRTLYGARISLLVGLVGTAVAVGIGVLYGMLAGWWGGRADLLMMRVVDLLYGLPYMFFVIVLMVWFGRSMINLFIGLGAVSWLTMARIVRGQVLSLRGRDYVLAARATGLPTRVILRKHILPNIAAPVLVYATLTVPRVMLEEAFLSFLGLGVQPPAASWGSLISEGAVLFREYPWLVLVPGAILSVTLLALNFFGDGLRDRMAAEDHPA
ncbi:MAG TPA: ABC transporter permease [Planctomycetes bacterium]|nr:ABC transporter permease [Planctomycetota bacterium]